MRGEDLTEQKQVLHNQLEKIINSKTKLKNILITEQNSFNNYYTKLSENSEYINNSLVTKRDYRS